MLHAEFQSIAKPADKQYIEIVNQMKTERKLKAPYTEKINTHVPSGLFAQSTFAYGDAFDP